MISDAEKSNIMFRREILPAVLNSYASPFADPASCSKVLMNIFTNQNQTEHDHNDDEAQVIDHHKAF